MNQKRMFHIVLVLLALSGILIAVLRYIATGTPFFPGQEKSVWLVEARIDFEAAGDAVSASLSLPDAQLPGFDVFAMSSAEIILDIHDDELSHVGLVVSVDDPLWSWLATFTMPDNAQMRV